MKSILPFFREFITKIIFISKHFNYSIHFLHIVSVRWCPLLSTHSQKRFWMFCITCYSMVGQIAATSSLMFCFKSTIVSGFFLYTLLLSYPQSKKSQALRSDNLAGHSVFPLREIMWAGNISSRTRIAVRAVWAVALSCWNQRVWFSTPSLQLRFQKCAKHLIVAGWVYCCCPACLVFKEIGANHPKRCYTTPNNNLLRT